MSRIDPVKKEIYKQSRLEGKSKGRSLIDAGYKETTALHCQNEIPLAKLGDQEIQEDIKKRITVEFVLNLLFKESQEAAKSSDRIRATELLGKYLQLFKEDIKQGTFIFNGINDLEKDLKRVVLPSQDNQPLPLTNEPKKE